MNMATHLCSWARLVAACGCLASGCLHNRANQYSYAPPLAPPVYPQPQQGTGPVVFAAPPAAGPAVTMPGTMPMTMPVAAPAGPTGPIMPQGFAMPTGDPCDPCHEGVVTTGAVYVDGGQTPPCPPGP
jgi:hypothetical protein